MTITVANMRGLLYMSAVAALLGFWQNSVLAGCFMLAFLLLVEKVFRVLVLVIENAAPSAVIEGAIKNAIFAAVQEQNNVKREDIASELNYWRHREYAAKRYLNDLRPNRFPHLKWDGLKTADELDVNKTIPDNWEYRLELERLRKNENAWNAEAAASD